MSWIEASQITNLMCRFLSRKVSLYIKKRAFLRSKTLPLKSFPGALPSDPQYPFHSLLNRWQSPKEAYDILCLEFWSARITKDSTEWDGLGTAACTLQMIEFTAFIQSQSYTIEVSEILLSIFLAYGNITQ